MTAAAAMPEEARHKPAWLLKGSSPASAGSGRDGSRPPAAKTSRKGDKDGDKMMIDAETAVGEGAASSAPPKDGKGKGKGKGHRGGRRGRRGANHAEKKWTSKDPQLQSLLGTLCKFTLQNSFKLRLTMATVIDTFTVEKDHGVVKRVEAVMVEYRMAIETARAKGHEALLEVGSPVASLTVGLLESLQDCDVGGKANKNIATYLDGVAPKSPGTEPSITRQNLELDVAAVRLEKCHDDTKVKIHLAAPQWPMRGTVTHALLSEGKATRHTGVAPPGWLEDELATWLDVLTKQ